MQKSKKISTKINILLVILLISLFIAITIEDKNPNEMINTRLPPKSSVYYENTTGSAHGVYVSGDYGYVADGVSGLAVIDVSDPTNPGTPVYEDTTDNASSVYVSGDYAYLADGSSGLAVINISDPTNPGTPIYKNTTGNAYDVYVSGDYAYVADFSSGLAVINISNPTNPGTPIYKNTTGNAYGVYVSGNYAYLADGSSGLAVINISDPTNPGTPIYKNTTGNAYSVYISGNFAYLADGSSGLAVINISNPTNPGTPVYEDTTDDARSVYVNGDYACVADYSSGLAVINISDPTNPGTPIYKNTWGNAYGVYISGNYAYLADGSSGLAVIEITVPIDPGTPVYEVTARSAIDIYVSGDYAYIADFTSGLAVIDISDPTDPGTPFTKDTDGSAYGVYVSGDYAYLADFSSGLAVIDISDPTDPGAPVYKDIIGFARDIYVSGDYAYIADFNTGLAVIDISDPTNPGNPNYRETHGSAYGVYVSGDYAYVAVGSSGLAIIDITDPTNPGTPNYENTTGQARDVCVSGDYAYIADWGSGLAIIDISDPTNPGTPVYENTTDDARSVYVSGDYAYVADGISGLAIVNISDPTNPGTPVYENTTGIANGVYVSGYYAYVADGSSGLAVIEIRKTVEFEDPIIISVPSDFTLEAGYAGETLSWTATDANPDTYTIELQGSGIVAGPTAWTSGVEITYNIPEGLTVGVYSYTVNFVDYFGNFITDSVDFTVEDTTDPTWDFVPTDQNIEFGDSLNYDLDASDASGIDDWWLNDTTYFTINDANGVITNIGQVPVGVHYLEVRAYDPYNQFCFATFKITVEDTTDPTWDFVPTDQNIEFGDSLNYDLDASEASGIDDWWLNDTTYFTINDANGVITNSTSLNVGIYWLEVRAYDPYSNYCTATFRVIVQDTDVPVWVQLPVDQNIEFDDSISYDLNATDASGIDDWWLNDTTYFTINDANGVITNIGQVPVGVHYLEVRAYDPYNQFCFATFKITVEDTTDPTWDFVPTDQNIEFGDGLNYDLDASDTSGIPDWWLNDTTYFTINDANGVITNSTSLNVGVYLLEVRAYDPYGQYCLATFKITVEDTTDPNWIQIPADQVIEYGDELSYDINATDTSGISDWWLNDTTYFTINNANGVITNIGQVPVGVHYLEVRAYDPYNQFCFATFKITVEDTTDPTWDFVPINQNIEFGEGLNYNLDASDASGISDWWLNDTTYFTINDANGIITNSTSLNVGVYWLEVRAYDPYSNYRAATIKITVEDTTYPNITSAPSDLAVELGYTGESLSWTATDPNPNTYTIELQGSGIVAGPTTWSSGLAITYNIPEGFAVGVYVYIINFTDDYGNNITDSIDFAVGDTNNPIIISAPSDLAVELGYTGESLSWTATDANSNTYTIELQGSGIVAGPTTWTSGVTIIYNIPDGFAIGVYIYIINFTDDYSNSIIENVDFTVEDTTDPMFTSTPSDFTVDYGYTGINISWTSTDLHPHTYTIELQGSGIVLSPTAWLSGVAIIYNVPDGLAVGDYIYTVNVTDQYHNSIIDTITLTVREVSTGGDTIPLELIIIISIGGVVVIAIAIAVLARRRRKST